MIGLLLTHKGLNGNYPTAAAVRFNVFYAYPAVARGTATSNEWHPHEANLLSGRRSPNARCAVQRSNSSTLFERFNLSFTPNNNEVSV